MRLYGKTNFLLIFVNQDSKETSFMSITETYQLVMIWIS